jgi:hypothetical protein
VRAELRGVAEVRDVHRRGEAPRGKEIEQRAHERVHDAQSAVDPERVGGETAHRDRRERGPGGTGGRRRLRPTTTTTDGSDVSGVGRNDARGILVLWKVVE